MKLISLPVIGLLILSSFSHPVCAQTSLDSVVVKTLRGVSMPFISLIKKDSAVLLCFWESSSEASINELNAINGKFEKWKKLAAFKMIAVCVNEGKDIGKVRPMVNAYGWVFDVCIDYDGSLRKAVGSGSTPQSILLYQGRVLYQQSGYTSGSEDYLIQRIQGLAPRQ